VTEQEAKVTAQKEQETSTAAQIESLKKELAELREKSEASAVRVENQQHAIKSLEDEKIELTRKRDELLKEHETHKAKLTKLEAARAELVEKRDELSKEQKILKAQVSDLTSKLDLERKQTTEKAQLLGKAREQLSMTLKVLGTEMAEAAQEKAEEKIAVVAR
jgi:chromosome segregation ATPase